MKIEELDWSDYFANDSEGRGTRYAIIDDRGTAIIDYGSEPERFALVRNYGDIREETVLTTDDLAEALAGAKS
jgi:hypothetical protein